MITPPWVRWDFRGILELTNFQEDFREALPYWLNQVFSTTQKRVERAVQVDQVYVWVFFFVFNIYAWFHSRRPLKAALFSLPAPTPADRSHANQAQLLRRGPGGVHPACLPTVGEALLA